MKQIIDYIKEEVEAAFEKAGIDPSYAAVTVSNRPDLCDYQCNGAMRAAKLLKKAPLAIAEELVPEISGSKLFSKVEAVRPGFINLTVNDGSLAEYAQSMSKDEAFGYEKTSSPKKIMLDYGGPNVAKPLHVGHLRSAIIGESIKRILTFAGHEVTGDVHLGDYGLQMGLIIAELQERKPDLPYFDPELSGDYPAEAPFTIAELEEIYPTASTKSKEDGDFYKKALAATKELQDGRPGYKALFDHIINVSVSDLKKNYERLNVSFDLWKGESDAAPYIPPMVEMMKEGGHAYESDGALVVDVSKETDAKEIPPCMILKSDGAALYDTTDLATLVWRMEDYEPDTVVYIVDKRQVLHFVQVFRCAKKTGIVPEETELTFLGFGTMNGRDGKPFKTREGGVMRLSDLISDINARMEEKIRSNEMIPAEEIEKTAATIGLSAIKYGDLSNQPQKDYVFDVDRFLSFEGNTGPYILYTIVRLGSILRKFAETGEDLSQYKILPPQAKSDRDVMLLLVRFASVIDSAAAEYAPNRIAGFVYELANAVNHFYHETKILAIEDAAVRGSYVCLIALVKRMMEQCIDLLGFDAPERM